VRLHEKLAVPAGRRTLISAKPARKQASRAASRL
jgi:hypothetical protein